MHFERLGVKVILVDTSSTTGNEMADYMIEVVESAEASEYSKSSPERPSGVKKAHLKRGSLQGYCTIRI